MHPKAIDADQIVGNWISPDNDLIVKCYKGRDGRYYGKILWYQIYSDNQESSDCEISQDQWLSKSVLSGFEYKNSEWTNGTIHNLENCNSYDAFIQMQPDGKLKATGFILFRWLSESIIFSRYYDKLPVQK